MEYVPYSDSVETIHPDEQKDFQDLAELFTRLGKLMTDRYRHAIRGVHAKSHGIVTGQFTVLPNLPVPLAQGLFSTPATYDALLRVSTNPGDILADSISTPRGIGLKIMGVPGARLPGQDAAADDQDFVFAVGPVFGAKDAKQFHGLIKTFETHANDPELLKKAVSGTARAANAVLMTVGLESATLEQLGYPSTHPLGESFFSQAALRHGGYIAKYCVRPKSDNLKALHNKAITSAFRYSALKDAIVEFFASESAEWEFCAQLCTNLEKMPVEDPTVQWDEKTSPYVPVATFKVPVQDAYSPPRRVLVDDRMSFSPWHGLEAHRPLGNIMRARQSSYERSITNRMTANAVCPFHAHRAADIPS